MWQRFCSSIYSDIIVESLAYCQQNKGLKIHAWCIMSNHIHLIVSSNEPSFIRNSTGFKKYTSSKIIKAIEENEQESRRNGMLWLFKRRVITIKEMGSINFGDKITIR